MNPIICFPDPNSEPRQLDCVGPRGPWESPPAGGALLVSPAPLVEQWFGTTLAGPPHHDLPRFTQIN
jgi:hypothetical protein